MRKLTSFLIISILINCISSAQAAHEGEIESVTILADSRLAVPLSQLASRFTHANLVSVSVVFGHGAEQKKKIEDGEPADIFITDNASLIQQLRIKGMVDVYSIGNAVTLDGVGFGAAVVAGENMSPARIFLQYLKSDEGTRTFKRYENSEATEVPAPASALPSPLPGESPAAIP